MIAKIYGFGSYFKGSSKFRDIDILIIHNSKSYSSCIEAISLKKAIVSLINNADVSMLSLAEEQRCDFINISKAILLLEYNGEDKSCAAHTALNKILAYKNIISQSN